MLTIAALTIASILSAGVYC
ncbi:MULTISPECIES: hypothetical protein [unclassified Providencia]|nr:hypothetical protein [Providencia sp. PROV211]